MLSGGTGEYYMKFLKEFESVVYKKGLYAKFCVYKGNHNTYRAKLEMHNHEHPVKSYNHKTERKYEVNPKGKRSKSSWISV